MVDKTKVFYLDSVFKKDALPTASDTIDSIFIEGYANTTTTDRVGDVITQDAWNNGIENYLKNPIVLFNHCYDEPIGKVIENRVDSHGLWVKARISAAAEDTFNLIKDSVLTTFSVGFMIKDAMYDAVTDLFVIKEVELLEISVVSVPCNQDSIFSLSKDFSSQDEYKIFKKQFATKEAPNNNQVIPPVAQQQNKEWNMDPKELEAMLAKAADEAAVKAASAVLKAQADEKAKADAEAKAKAEFDAKIKSAVDAQIEVGQSGAEKLLADVEKRFAEQTASTKGILDGLEASLKEKAEELAAIQKSKMTFTDKGKDDSYADRETAVLLAKFSNKSIGDTKFGKDLIQKVGPHQASATWETEVSLNLENDIRRKLVVAPVFRSVNMATNVMKVPFNPDAGIGTWIVNTAFGTTASPGAAQTHQLQEVTLSAYKVATMEYMNFEEEEDSLLVLTPIIRDAMIRRVARAVDRAYLRGAGSGADPVSGVALYDTTSAVNATNTGVATMANMRALRKDLGIWGLDPANFVYIVSQDVYYDLMEDTSFQSVLQVGMQNATLLTGQVGVIGSTPVLVSGEFPSKAGGTVTATTNIAALAVAPGNFLAGNQRGLRFDTQQLVETQRTVLVASLRTGVVQLGTAQGLGVSTLRWS